MPPQLLAPPAATNGHVHGVMIDTATLVLVRSPIAGHDGHLRVVRAPLDPGRTVAESLPPGQARGRVVWNGGVLTEVEQQQVVVHPGDELWLWPTWGISETAGALIIYAAISIAVGIAVQVATYYLFPPAKPHINAPDDHTFSFEGIRTAIGPGSVVPIVYGRHRVGGQLISAAVDQALTIRDDGFIPNRLDLTTAPPTLSLLLAVSEGPVQDVNVFTIQLNGQPIANFPSTVRLTRLGEIDQTPLPEFAEQRNTFADGREIPYAPTLEGDITYTTTTPIHAFVLNIVFNQGLYNMTGKGEKESNSVSLYYRWRTNTNGAHGNFTEWVQLRVTGDRTGPVRLGIRHENLPLATYDIAVAFANVRTPMDELKAKWQPTLESVSEVQNNTLAYPGTALLGLRSVATDALQGALPNVTLDVVGRTVRVGTFAPDLTWSDNPAWCVMDFLTNTRYGLGIPDSDIDLQAFTVWGDYCNTLIDGEPRHRMNYVVSQESRAQTLLMDMMGGSRALLVKSGGLWTPRVTRNDPPVQLLSWANCRNVRLTYTRDADRVNVMEARFANEENEYQQDVLTWPPVEQWPADVHKQSLDIRGVTKPSRIIRALQFELNRRRFENMLLEMDASLEAVALQVHDIFRFAHPLPGWGVSGRLEAGSTASMLRLDEAVTMTPGQAYHVYLRFPDDGTDARLVVNPGDGLPHRTLTIVGDPFQQLPLPRTTLWACGRASPEGAIKLFRVTHMQRKSDTIVHLQAVAHNPSIYDEPEGVPLPVISLLFNPLGPPPPLTFLLLTEVTRVQPSGASLRVVNLSWDVAALSAGYAPYGGAKLLRRTVLSSALAGSGEAGTLDLGQLHDPNDPNVDFVPLADVRGHVLDFDDFTVLTGITYIYRVVPISSRGVPNEAGALEQAIHVAGPTTPDFFPGTVRNLRLQGQAVGVHVFDGRDIHFAWDPVAESALFSETFFVQDYVVQVWAPGQEYLLRTVTVPATTTSAEVSWTYTYEQNSEDQLANGFAGPRRDVALYVFARTNTGRMSLDPATITVSNPPPDMSAMAPEVQALFEAALISWNEFVEPRDFAFYQVYLDTVTPPRVLYQDVSVAFRKIFPGGLLANVPYYTYILPFDSFGAGLASQISTFTPVSLTADNFDTTPPEMPTGLALTTGTTLSADATVVPWVAAAWTPNTEADIGYYAVHVLVGTSAVPTVMTIAHPEHALRLEALPGHSTVRVKMSAFDKTNNQSAYTPELSITTAGDTTVPDPPTNLFVHGTFKAIAVLWLPPAVLDYALTEIWASSVNNLQTAGRVGVATTDFIHPDLPSGSTWYYWVRACDTSGNFSAFTPGPTAGMPGTTVLTVSADIGNLSITETKIANDSISTPKLQANSVDANKVTTGELITLGAQIRAATITDAHITDLSAGKIESGTITAFVSIGVGNSVHLDGTYSRILIYDRQPVMTIRMVLGRLGDLGEQYGMQIWNASGQLMWNFTDGATVNGIADNAISAQKIRASTITASHLRTDTAVITNSIQIANALIGYAHIQDAAIITAKIQDAAITSAKIGLNQIGTGHYQDGSIASAKIALNQILTSHIADAQITTAKIGAAQILAANIGYAQILAGHIADAQITSAKIQDAAITSAKIGDAQIARAHIIDLQVDTAKIENLAVITSKIGTNAVSVAIQVSSGLTASISFGDLVAGDQIWLVGTGTASDGGGGGVSLELLEDALDGPVRDSASAAHAAGFVASMAVQAVYTVTTSLSLKVFWLQLGGASGTTRFVGLLRRK